MHNTWFRWTLGAVLTASLWQGAIAEDGQRMEAKVAITFDDLPSHGILPPGLTRADVARRFTAALKAEKAPPVYGFLNAVALKWDPSAVEVLKIWRDGGNLIGNHTFSHLDPDTVSAEAFEADIVADEPALQDAMRRADWRYLRLPFLREGETAEKRAHIDAFLTARGYRLADVTMAFNDYDYNPAYVRCLAKNDAAGLAWLQTQFLASAQAAISYGRETAQKTFGRDINHVFLLHYGAFDSLMFPQVLALMKQNHLQLATLPEVQKDPVYKDYRAITAEWGGSLLARAMVARNVPVPPSPPDNHEELAKICQ